mgnify:CR=1 FL=1
MIRVGINGFGRIGRQVDGYVMAVRGRAFTDIQHNVFDFSRRHIDDFCVVEGRNLKMHAPDDVFSRDGVEALPPVQGRAGGRLENFRMVGFDKNAPLIFQLIKADGVNARQLCLLKFHLRTNSLIFSTIN